MRTATTVGPLWPVTFTAAHPVEVLGDPARLRQVVDNLLANVRAHTPEGTAATVHVDQAGSMARVVIRDNGPGMPAEDAARVFERFYRADPARGRNHGGTGLGLSIVSAIVSCSRRHRLGRVGPRPGMTVTVSLPVAADVLDAEESDDPGADAPDADAPDADADESDAKGVTAVEVGADGADADGADADGADAVEADGVEPDSATAARKGQRDRSGQGQEEALPPDLDPRRHGRRAHPGCAGRGGGHLHLHPLH